jgi:hypothetical protein
MLRADGALSAALTELEAVGAITGMMATAIPPTMMAADAQSTRRRRLPESHAERFSGTAAPAPGSLFALGCGSGFFSAARDALGGALSAALSAVSSISSTLASVATAMPAVSALLAQPNEQ